MVVKFSSINYDFQLQIAAKMDAKDFVQFVQSSKHSRELSKKMKKRATWTIRHVSMDGGLFPLNLQRELYGEFFDFLKGVPIRISFGKLIGHFHLNESNCEKLIDFFLKTASSCEIFRRECIWIQAISPSKFNSLLEAARVKEFDSKAISEDFLRIPVIFKLQGLVANWYLDDDEFICLQASKMKLTNTLVSSEGINSFLKQWIARKREIRRILLLSSKAMNRPVIISDIETIPGLECRLKDIDYEVRRPGENNFLRVRIGNFKVEIGIHYPTCPGYCDPGFCQTPGAIVL